VAATPKAVKDAADAKVDKAGDTMTGNLYVAKAGNAYVQAENKNTGVKLNLDCGSSQYHGIYSVGYYDGSSFPSNASWMIYRNGAGNTVVNGSATDNVLKSGDTMTGGLHIEQASGDVYCYAKRTDTSVQAAMGVGSGGANHGIYSWGYNDGSYHSDGKWMIYRDYAGTVVVNGKATDNVLKSGDTMTGDLTFAVNKAINKTMDDSSNWSPLVYFINQTPSSYTYKPHIGFWNAGGNSSHPGVIDIIPYGINTSPWNRADGLSISRDDMRFNGSIVRTGTVAVADGGTGATTAANARTNLGAAPAPTIVDKSTTSTSATAITAEYTVSGSGTVIVYAGIYSDATSDYGTWQAEIYYDGTLIMGEGTRFTTTTAQKYGASTSVPVEVTNGKKIKITLFCSKIGTKNIFRRFLCFGCTVS
jgi:hypothetical protein